MSFLLVGNADVMVCKLEMRFGGPYFQHMTRYAVFCAHSTFRGKRLSLCTLHFCGPAVRRVTCDALRIIIGAILLKRLVRIMARRATYAAVVRVTLAVEDPVGLKANVVDLQTLKQRELIVDPMTGGTKLLGQFVAAEPTWVKNQLGAGLPRLTRRHVLSAGAMTCFTSNTGRHLVQMNQTTIDGAGRVTTEAIQHFLV